MLVQEGHCEGGHPYSCQCGGPEVTHTHPSMAQSIQSRPKFGPKSAQSQSKVGPKSTQSRPKVSPKSAQSRGPKSVQSRSKVKSKSVQSWPEVGPKWAQKWSKVGGPLSLKLLLASPAPHFCLGSPTQYFSLIAPGIPPRTLCDRIGPHGPQSLQKWYPFRGPGRASRCRWVSIFTPSPRPKKRWPTRFGTPKSGPRGSPSSPAIARKRKERKDSSIPNGSWLSDAPMCLVICPEHSLLLARPCWPRPHSLNRRDPTSHNPCFKPALFQAPYGKTLLVKLLIMSWAVPQVQMLLALIRPFIQAVVKLLSLWISPAC